MPNHSVIVSRQPMGGYAGSRQKAFDCCPPKPPGSSPRGSVTMGAEGIMDTSLAARRTEDIALDLLKFIASTTNVVRSGGSSTPGFSGAAAPKGEDQVTQLLDLYGRCRAAVEAGAK